MIQLDGALKTAIAEGGIVDTRGTYLRKGYHDISKVVIQLHFRHHLSTFSYPPCW
jgi:hypothetical protein